MKVFLRNDKGVALVTVIIITAVILLFGAVLVDASVQGLKLAKHSRNVDFARYAGDTAIENWFNKIANKANDEEFINGVLSEAGYTLPSTEEEAISYAVEIVNKIKEGLNERQYIDISAELNKLNSVVINGSAVNNLSALQGFSYDDGDAITDLSEVRIDSVTDEEGNKDLSVEVVAAEFDAENNILKVTIGLTVNALYTDGTYSTDNRRIYAEKTFEFKLPEIEDGFQLEYAILTLGDLYVNHVEGNVKGDVNVFGTFPKAQEDPRQYYYGGIYAINEAKLNLMGNAYTRSFIRTGPYKVRAFYPSGGGSDKSSIHIYKDAVAQNIQLFGNDTEIAVYRNAYTFVDLEINSEDSILFVNGSYVGLTKGREIAEGYIPHDNLSGIVNSAIIHNLLSEASQRSRIFIGGDVIVPGGTMKIDPVTGRVVGQIEDASTAWWDYTTGNGPFYRLYYARDDEIPDSYHMDLVHTYDSEFGYLGGHMNFFQVPDFRVNIWGSSFANWFNTGFYTDNSLRSEIESAINRLRNLSIADAKRDLKKLNDVKKISGAWTYALAANGGLYEYSNEEGKNDLTKLQFLSNSSYVLDNIFDGDSLKYDSNYWKIPESIRDVEANEEVWRILEGSRPEDDASSRNIVNDLYDRAQPFLTREYGDAKAWKTDERMSKSTGDMTLFNEIIYEIEGRITVFQSSDSFIDVDRIAEERGINNLILPDIGMEEDKYYFVYNRDPEVTVTVNGDFNGIIFTTGTVILEGGANVKGSIVSAGGGESIDGSFVPRAKVGIEMDETLTTLEALDRGDYAGVKFIEGSGSINVDFYLGLLPGEVLTTAGFVSTDYKMLNKAARINLLNKLNANGINLFNVF